MYFSEKIKFVCNENLGMKEFNEQLDKRRKLLFNPDFPENLKTHYSKFEDIKECIMVS